MAILNVGPDSTFPTIAAAMSAAGPNDTILLEAGYSNETATVTHSGMIISGASSSIGIVLQLATGIATVTVAGTAPINVLDASDANDIVGNDGDNVITVTDGADAVAGGLGIDRLIVDYHLATGAVTGDSTSNFAEAGGSRLVTITNGTFENFTIFTGSGADTITVGDGNNIINVGNGANTVTAGQGVNSITGGNDADTITAGDGGNFIDGGDGKNVITSGGGDDVIMSGVGADTIVAGGGKDAITVRGGADTVDSGSGDDLLIVDYSAANTAVTGGITGGNFLSGYTGHIADLVGNEVDFVNTENFTVTTGSGNDVITTGGGADTLNGGAGFDTLIGGAGADKFVIDGNGLADALSANPIFDDVKDYDHGNAGVYSAAEGDQIDVSSIVGSAFGNGQAASALVRVVDDPSGAHALLQVDSDGTANGAHWTTLAQLDGIHGSDTINVIVSGSQSSATSFSVLSDDGHFGDFDGDGKADLLWRNDDGAVATWQMNDGTVTASNFLPGVSSDWHILGTGDFNADGKSDILWQNDDGALLDWQMANSSTIGSSFGIGPAPANSQLAGIGDVDNDGKADLIWRDLTTGTVTINTMAGATNTVALGTDWSVVGVSDYNGDGMADIMFRNESQGINAAWLMNGTSVGSTVFYPGVSNDWHVEATGDFDGNGTSDLLWHNDNGANAVWLMNGSGAIQQSAFFDGVGSDWHLVGTGDFNGDHKDDIVWRNDDGSTAIWLMNGANTPTVSFPGGVANDWATQAHHYEYV